MYFLDLILISFLVTIALIILFSRDLLYCTMIFSAYSFFSVIIWQELGAPDLALIEAVVGVGITSIIFIVAIRKTERYEEEEIIPDERFNHLKRLYNESDKKEESRERIL
ncbi:DUF4040 domain-containing protein [Candidatus Desantisbacteria bacterium]|nr:DUF4040 domain-containing protein [Candidatus Desantisbacteria bacterium]